MKLVGGGDWKVFWLVGEPTFQCFSSRFLVLAAGKLTYDRDFLLQFQYNPVCKEKPQGLPDIEVVMKEPRGPPKASGGR